MSNDEDAQVDSPASDDDRSPGPSLKETAEQVNEKTAEQERRRRAARLLGDLTPSSSSDSVGWNEAHEGGGTHDDDLRREVPPHHGRD